MTADDLARGLHACLDRADPWPPTLPEFRALCLPPKILAPYHRAFPKTALLESDEVKAARKAHARAALDGLQQLLRPAMMA
jgi:hypothetical protein